MKIFKLPQLAEAAPNGEYCLCTEKASTGSVYILYGRLRPGEGSHKMTLPAGHEEIICVVKGEMAVNCDRKRFTVSAGEAFNPGECRTLELDNTGDGEAIYISARGCPARVMETQKTATEKKTAEAGTSEDEKTARTPEKEDDGFVITNDGLPLEE